MTLTAEWIDDLDAILSGAPLPAVISQEPDTGRIEHHAQTELDFSGFTSPPHAYIPGGEN